MLNPQKYEVRTITDVRDLLLQSAQLFADRTAYILKDGRRITYDTLAQQARALAAALCDAGYGGKKVVIYAENRYEWALCYLALICGAGIPVPLDRELKAEELATLTAASGASLLVHSKKKKAAAQSAADAIPGLALLEMDDAFPDLLARGEALLEAGQEDCFTKALDCDAMAVLLYTSGTTGNAKGVMLSHRNLVANVMSTAKMVRLYQDDVLLSVLPLHHTYECTLGFLEALYSGAQIAFCGGVKDLPKDLLHYRPTVLVTVPLLLDNLQTRIYRAAEKKKGGRAKIAIGCTLARAGMAIGIDRRRSIFREIHDSLGGRLRLFIVGAAPVTVAVSHDFESFGFRVYQGYGLTECSPLVIGNGDRYCRADSCGLAIPDVTAELVDVNENGVGEIRCTGESVMLGYYQNEEETAKVLRDGWFYTGDLATRDADGWFRIVGRKKNVIVTRSGENVYPEELETYLADSQFVREVVVLGELDAQGDTVVSAQIFPDMTAIGEKLGTLELPTPKQVRAVLDEVIADINKKVPVSKMIRNLDVRETEFAKTTTKKIKRMLEKGAGTKE